MHRRDRLSSELMKRIELREQLEREARAPLTDQPLSETEREAIASRVRRGKARQSKWNGSQPAGAGSPDEPEKSSRYLVRGRTHG